MLFWVNFCPSFEGGIFSKRFLAEMELCKIDPWTLPPLFAGHFEMDEAQYMPSGQQT
jgi:hypothetical protein